jgi:hypothetical protein
LVSLPVHDTADQNVYRGSVVDGEDLVPPPLPELPPDYPPPPPPPPLEEAMMNGGIGQQYCMQMDISEADDRMKRFYGMLNICYTPKYVCRKKIYEDL